MSNITPARHRRRIKLDYEGAVSRTEQSHRDVVSIHRIMERYKERGVIDHVSAHKGTYGNFVGIPGFQEANQIIAEAKSLFESVPSHIRKDFNNNPGDFLDFMQKSENREKIEEYGLDASHLPPVVEEPTPDPTPGDPPNPPPDPPGAPE